MDNTIMLQGSFISNGISQYIPLISGVSYIQVTNYTEALATIGAGNVIVEAKWRIGMPAGSGVVYYKGIAANAANMTQVVAANCFTLFDSSAITLGTLLAVNAISAAAIPVVTCAVNHNLPAVYIVNL